jgi:pimeloyl-ACP methyl ester carboxylesterase
MNNEKSVKQSYSWILSAILGGFFILPRISLASTKTQCFKETLPVKFNYCITIDPKSTNPDLVYYFHGLDSDETRWAKKMGKNIYRAWSMAKEAAPAVVAVSMPTKYWFLLKENLARPTTTGLFEVFTQKMMPLIESRFPQPIGRRMAFGESMGGINVAMLVSKAPHLIDKAAMVCPVIPEYSPYEPIKAIAATFSGAEKSKVQQYVIMGLSMFASTEDWSAEYPPYIVRDSFGPNSPDLYISAGNKDSYGIFKPAENFSKIAKSKGVKTTWVPLKGGHCVFDFPSIAKFLVE